MSRVKDHLFSNPRLDRIAEWSFTLGMVALFTYFAVRFGRDFLETYRLSSFLAVALSTLRAVLFLTRRQPQKVSVDPFAWVVGVAGTWTPLLLRVVPGQEQLAGQALQVVGFTLQVVAVVSLNRSIGVVAANRGIKTGGLYRLIRHPLYASYVVSYAGLLINQFSGFNLAVLGFWAFFQIMRIHYEEDVLSLDPEYQSYMQRTRWRILPYVF